MKDDGLKRFMDMARRGRNQSAPPAEVPFGFATRVTARAFSERKEDPLALWERLARWSLVTAFAVCLVTAVLHPRTPSSSALAEFAGLNAAPGELW